MKIKEMLAKCQIGVVVVVEKSEYGVVYVGVVEDLVLNKKELASKEIQHYGVVNEAIVIEIA